MQSVLLIHYSIPLLLWMLVLIFHNYKLYSTKHFCIMSSIFIILNQFHCSSFISLKVWYTELKLRFFSPVKLPGNLYKHNWINISIAISGVPQVRPFSVTTVLKTHYCLRSDVVSSKNLYWECVNFHPSAVTLGKPLFFLELSFLKLILTFKFWQFTHLDKGINWCLWSRKIFWHLPQKTDLPWYYIWKMITQENKSVC